MGRFYQAAIVKYIDSFFSPRLLAFLGGSLATAGFMGRAFVPLTSLWHILAFVSISGFGFGVMEYVTVISLEHNFNEAFPTAYTLSQMVGYFGVACVPPIFGYLVRNFWQGTAVFGLGILTSGMIIIEALSVLSEAFGSPTPATNGSQQGGTDKTDESRLLSGQSCDSEIKSSSSKGLPICSSLVRQHPTLVPLLIMTGLNVYEYAAWTIYLVPYGESLGLVSETAIWLSTAGGLVGVLGKACGIIPYHWDHIVLPIGAILPTVVLVVSYGISLVSENVTVLMLMACGSGFSISLWGSVCGAWLPRVVCSSHFKEALAISFVVHASGNLFGAMLTGAVIDASESYRYAFASLTLLSLIGTGVSVMWYLFETKWTD